MSFLVRHISILLMSMIILLVCWPRASYAQNLSMWRITDEEGLPSMIVYDLHQDSKGYIWMGTEMGLARYDGISFRLFDLPESRSKSVTDIREDSQGNLYFVNFAGQLFQYNITQGIKAINLQTLDYPINYIPYIIDQNDQLWLGTDKLYVKLAGDSIWETVYDFDKSLVIDISISPDGKIWASTNSQEVYLFSPEKVLMNKFKIDLNSENSDFRLSHSDHGSLLLNRRTNQFFKLEGETFIPVERNFSEKLLFTKKDKEGNLWLCSFDGIMKFERKASIYDDYEKYMHGLVITDIMQDREDNFWLSTLNEGVFVIPNQNTRHIIPYPSFDIRNNSINALVIDRDGNKYLGMNNGSIVSYDKKNQRILDYELPNKKEIESLHLDEDGIHFYAGAGRIYKFKKGNKLPISYMEGAAPKSIKSFGEDFFVIGNSFSSYFIAKRSFGEDITPPMIRREEKKPKQILSGKLSSGILRNARSRDVMVSENGYIWTAHIDGLYVFTDEGEKEIKLADGSSIYARTLGETSDGSIWAGSLGQGLIEIKDLEVVRIVTTDDGLISNHCRSLATDGNNVWVGSERGVSYFDRRLNRVFKADRSKGVLGNEILDIAVDHEMVYLATSRGLFFLPKNELSINEVPPLVYITSLQINGKTKIPEGQVFRLTYDENNVSINFEGLAYKSRGEFRFRYRLIGLQDFWTDQKGNIGQVRFPSLQPGNYQFEIIAINEDGIESEKVAQLQFVILPPFWQTWWFRIGVLALLSLGVYLLVKKRTERAKKESEMEKALRNYQLAAIKAQMNPHFIFNVLNSIQRFIMLNDKMQANFYLGKFSDLIRIILSMSNEERVSLHDEIKALELYLELEALRFGEKFQYKLNIPQDLPLEELMIPSMLIQPYVENALKHGLFHLDKNREKMLQIRFYEKADGDLLICEIEDNGIGRKRSEEINKLRPKLHKSFASTATQNRLKLLNHHRKNAVSVKYIDLFNTKGEECGLKVVLEIPIYSKFSTHHESHHSR